MMTAAIGTKTRMVRRRREALNFLGLWIEGDVLSVQYGHHSSMHKLGCGHRAWRQVMSWQEFHQLMQFGTEWHIRVWMHRTSNTREVRRDILRRLQEFLDACDTEIFSVRTGWQQYDTYVRAKKAREGTYAALTEWAASQPDGGAGLAQQMLDWMTGDTPLSDLPRPLALLAVIVSFAEMARGYVTDVQRGFHDWMWLIAHARDPANARTLWRGYRKDFTPALTYKEDVAVDPKDLSDTESDSEGGGEMSDSEYQDVMADAEANYPNGLKEAGRGKRKRK